MAGAEAARKAVEEEAARIAAEEEHAPMVISSSDCHAETVAGWGKYADVTQTVQCHFVENITQNTFILAWTGEFTTP